MPTATGSRRTDAMVWLGASLGVHWSIHSTMPPSTQPMLRGCPEQLRLEMRPPARQPPSMPTPSSWGKPNTPPWCYVPTVATRAVTGNPTEIDYFQVAKPSSLQSSDSRAAPGFPVAPTSTVYNGVDQQALASCLATDASRCLQTVPGLAACVQEHSTCNVTAPVIGLRTTGVKATADSVRTSATRALGLSGNRSAGDTARVAVSTADDLARAANIALIGVAASDRVLVVTGKETVNRLHDRSLDAHHGYRLVYHETTGVLLDACLGSACLSGIA